jgi:carbon monoxide dehydrogenase subunit G
MKIELDIAINGTKEEIWNVISDIENSVNTIEGIENIEILEKPNSGLVGLKWIETRKLFGKTATETMWITESVENSHYHTRAESHGAIYTTRLSISEHDRGSLLTMEFSSKTLNFGAKLMSVIFGSMFKNATKKVVVKDLEDIKIAVEQGK